MEMCTQLAQTHKDMDVSAGLVDGLCLDCVQCAVDIYAVGRLAFSQRWESLILMPIGRS